MPKIDKRKAALIDAKCKAILDWVAERKVEPRISYFALCGAHSNVEQRWLRCGAHVIPGPEDIDEMDLVIAESSAILDLSVDPNEIVYEDIWAATNVLGDKLYGKEEADA